MAEPKTFLDEILASWYAVRRDVIREVRNLPASRMSFRATLETRSVLEIVQHVLEVAIMSVEELVRDDTNFHRGTLTQLVNIYAPNISRADTQEKLINILAEQFTDADTRLREKGDLWMLQRVTLRDGSSGTRLGAVHEAIGHERHHLGQLTVHTRLLGLIPEATQQQPIPPYSSIVDRV